MTSKQWTANEINDLVRGFQAPCVIVAAAELDLFGQMGSPPFSAEQAAAKLKSDLRGVTILLDALAALRLLDKQSTTYTVPQRRQGL